MPKKTSKYLKHWKERKKDLEWALKDNQRRKNLVRQREKIQKISVKRDLKKLIDERFTILRKLESINKRL